MTFGHMLKEARQKVGLTQEDIVREVGVTRQTVSNWENDRSYPDLGSIVKLSDLYGISLDDLLKQDADLRKRMEAQRERTKRILSGLISLGMLLVTSNFILTWLEQNTLGIILGLVGIVLVCGVHALYVFKLGADRKEALLRCAALVMWFSGLMILIHSGHTNRFGDVLWMGGMALECVCTYRMNWNSFYPKHTTAFTGFVIALVLVFFTLPMADNIMEQGDHVAGNPFTSSEYRVVDVIHGDDQEKPIVYLGSTNSVWLHYSDHSEEFDGKFSFIPQPEGSSRKGVWELIPEDAPGMLYRVTLKLDDSVIMTCLQDDVPQWEYLLEKSPRAGVTVHDVLSVSTGAADWHYAGTFDSESVSGGRPLHGKGTISVSIPGDETSVTIYEEYRSGDTVEHRTLVLNRDEKGSVEFERAASGNTETQLSIFRIPYEDGEFVFVLNYVP